MSGILFGVSGSAACFKAVAACSALAQSGHHVQAVLSNGAAKLVTPLQFSCVTGVEAAHEEWKPRDPAGMDHIAMAREARLLIVAPCTADRIGLLANGLAPDLLGSLALAFGDGPRLLAPAMNPEMWRHPAVQRNLERLRLDGWQVLGPAAGATACGEEGEGRMLEAAELVAAVEAALAG